jgi:hypothetical protein
MINGTTLSPRTAAPICGQLNFDVKNTLSGAWWNAPLTSNTPATETGSVAFIADNVDPSVAVISIGDTVPGITTGRYLPASGAAPFPSVQYSASTQTTVCYDKLTGSANQNQILLVSLIAADQIRIEGQQGSCAANPKFTSAAVTMYR